MFRLVRQTNPQARTIVITGHRCEMDQVVQQVLDEGADAVCYKPFDVPQLLDGPGATGRGASGPGKPEHGTRGDRRWLADFPPHVLVIEDDADTRANLCDILELDDYRVETAGTAAEALAATTGHDLRRSSWTASCPTARPRNSCRGSGSWPRDAAVMIVTGYADLQGAIAALRQGAADYILKPINADCSAPAWRASPNGSRPRRRSSTQQGPSAPRDELQTCWMSSPSASPSPRTPGCQHIRVNPAFATVAGEAPDSNASLNARSLKGRLTSLCERQGIGCPSRIPLAACGRARGSRFGKRSSMLSSLTG